MTTERRWLLWALLAVALLVGAVGGYGTVALLADSESVSVTFRTAGPALLLATAPRSIRRTYLPEYTS